MAKAGIYSFTQWLATYLAAAGVRVNAIAPGFFVNERSRKLLYTPSRELSDRGERVMHHTPMRAFGEARQLLGAMNWLIDDGASGFVTGVMLPVDGGFLSSAGLSVALVVASCFSLVPPRLSSSISSRPGRLRITEHIVLHACHV
jgi:NAD(P)-dependent dehydrogenase (short-subunit alcohol dehydrogenase family)